MEIDGSRMETPVVARSLRYSPPWSSPSEHRDGGASGHDAERTTDGNRCCYRSTSVALAAYAEAPMATRLNAIDGPAVGAMTHAAVEPAPVAEQAERNGASATHTAGRCDYDSSGGSGCACPTTPAPSTPMCLHERDVQHQSTTSSHECLVTVHRRKGSAASTCQCASTTPPTSKWGAVLDWHDMAGVLAEYLSTAELVRLRCVSRDWQDAAPRLLPNLHRLTATEISVGRGLVPSPNTMRRVERLDLRSFGESTAGTDCTSAPDAAWLRKLVSNANACARLRTLIMSPNVPRALMADLLCRASGLTSLSLAGIERVDDAVSMTDFPHHVACTRPPHSLVPRSAT